MDSDYLSETESVNDYQSTAEEQAHCRDKMWFTNLKNVIPGLKTQRLISQTMIAQKAIDYITFMKSKIKYHEQEGEDLQREVKELQAQIANHKRILENKNGNVQQSVLKTSYMSANNYHHLNKLGKHLKEN